MTIFEYRKSLIQSAPDNKKTSYIKITNEPKDNVTTFLFGKTYRYTLPKRELKKIIAIIDKHPALFDIKELESNNSLEGDEFQFTFSNGEKTNSFTGYNILDYGSKPRKNATLALRIARDINESVLQLNNIRTTIPNRLQHWPKYRKSSNLIKI